MELKDAPVEDVLQTSLQGQALDYSIQDKTIFVIKPLRLLNHTHYDNIIP